MPFRVKRVYDPPAAADGYRVLVDRLWPRGLSKANARIDVWARSLSPSNELRQWYGHDPARWEEFRRRYAAELRGSAEPMRTLRSKARNGTVTLLFSSRELHYNNAQALRGMLEG